MNNSLKITQLVLKLNAAFSSLVGLDLILLNAQFMEWMGISNKMVLPIVGMGLLLFGGFVAFTAFKKPFHIKMLRLIILQDVGWVLACLVVAPLNLFLLSSLGNILILLSAIPVTLFAFFQFRGLKQLETTA